MGGGAAAGVVVGTFDCTGTGGAVDDESGIGVDVGDDVATGEGVTFGGVVDAVTTANTGAAPSDEPGAPNENPTPPPPVHAEKPISTKSAAAISRSVKARRIIVHRRSAAVRVTSRRMLVAEEPVTAAVRVTSRRVLVAEEPVKAVARGEALATSPVHSARIEHHRHLYMQKNRLARRVRPRSRVA